MTDGNRMGVHTLDVLVKYTMSRKTAEQVMKRFIDMGIAGQSQSYMDCVLFDAALDVLGEEQAYYGLSDEEWKNIQEQRKKADATFGQIKVIDVTDTWKEVLCEDRD